MSISIRMLNGLSVFPSRLHVPNVRLRWRGSDLIMSSGCCTRFSPTHFPYPRAFFTAKQRSHCPCRSVWEYVFKKPLSHLLVPPKSSPAPRIVAIYTFRVDATGAKFSSPHLPSASGSLHFLRSLLKIAQQGPSGGSRSF